MSAALRTSYDLDNNEMNGETDYREYCIDNILLLLF